METLYALTPQPNRTIPVIETWQGIFVLYDWYREAGWGFRRLDLRKQPYQNLIRLFRCFNDCISFRRVGGKHILSQSRELNLKECHQYLLSEYGEL